MKVMTIVGTRPEIIRLACIIKKLDSMVEHILVHTGQNWDPNLNDIFFTELGLRKPDYFFNIVGTNLGESMGNIIAKSYELMEKIMPDAVLILGDTNSGLAVISAKRLKIPIFHMEAGNRCFDQRVPEEINRKIIDHTSDINLPYTEYARTNLLREGCPPNRVIVTGSPLKEVYQNYNTDIENSKILENLELTKNKYILWSTHREENIDIESNWKKVVQCINTVANQYNQMPIIVSTHPRTKKKITNENIVFPSNVKLCLPFGLLDYIKLQKNAYVVISDSGTISEESAMLNVPAVHFRYCTERQETIDKGTIMLSGLDPKHLLNTIEMTVQLHPNEFTMPPEYCDTNVSDKIIKIIMSYTFIINDTVWRKSN